MATGAEQNYITESQLLSTSYAMIGLTSTVALFRIGIQIARRKSARMEDYLILLAYILFLVLSAMYIIVTPALYRMTGATTGHAPLYPTLMDDALFVIQVFFTTSMLFWCVLWTVKFSLLALYRRLTIGLHNSYTTVWWGIFGFCVLTLIGCIISNFTSCHSMHAWFTPGECITPRDARAQIASLYYAFGTDVLCDLMIMAFPIRLIWNLQMARVQKFSIIALFCTGFICILFAIIRVVQIGTKAGNSSTPSSSWLALWAVIECSIAVIIGCCPGFATLFGRASGSSNVSYNTQGYLKYPSSRSNGQRSDDLKLNNVTSTTNRLKESRSDPCWDDGSSSQEQLAVLSDRIVVTRTIRQENEQVG